MMWVFYKLDSWSHVFDSAGRHERRLRFKSEVSTLFCSGLELLPHYPSLSTCTLSGSSYHKHGNSERVQFKSVSLSFSPLPHPQPSSPITPTYRPHQPKTTRKKTHRPRPIRKKPHNPDLPNQHIQHLIVLPIMIHHIRNARKVILPVLFTFANGPLLSNVQAIISLPFALIAF